MKAHGIAVRKGPGWESADHAGEFRRFRYAVSGSGTMPDLVAFVRAVREARLPCAFRSLRLLAAGKGRVAVDADVDFIARQ